LVATVSRTRPSASSLRRRNVSEDARLDVAATQRRTGSSDAATSSIARCGRSGWSAAAMATIGSSERRSCTATSTGSCPARIRAPRFGSARREASSVELTRLPLRDGWGELVEACAIRAGARGVGGSPLATNPRMHSFIRHLPTSAISVRRFPHMPRCGRATTGDTRSRAGIAIPTGAWAW
jgi:hypothetical protein